ncbi:MAG: BamA/TamA family outer membrane protein [Planctomycetes bacterium]|nr:BamA/TamA family outer membrane protein [Planctomycetota bacterium]
MRFALLCILGLAAPLLFAQRVPDGAEGKRISSIELFVKSEGKVFERAPDSASRQLIFGAMRTAQGKQFDSKALKQDIDYLTDTSHMFRSVDWEVSYDSEAETTGVKLVFTQPLIWRIRVVAPIRGKWSEDGVTDFWRARNQMDSAEGSEFSIRRMDADVQRMYDTGGFLDIRCEYKFTKEGVDLLFRVIQNQPLEILQFSGVYQAGFQSSLKDVIAGIKPIRDLPQDPPEGTLVSPRYFPKRAFDGDIVTDANPANILGASEQITGYYRVNGFAFTTVKARLISLPTVYDPKVLLENYGALRDNVLDTCKGLINDGYGGKLVLVFDVYEGPQWLVGDIQFSGLDGVKSLDNGALSGSRVSGLFGPVLAFWYHFLSSSATERAAALGEEMRTKEGSPYVEADVVRDAETLQSYFRARGWLDARVSFSNFQLNETRNRINVDFHVDTGSPYAVTNVRIEYETRAPRVPKGAEPKDFDKPAADWDEMLEWLGMDDVEALSAQLAVERFGTDYMTGKYDAANGHWFASYDLTEPVPFDEYAISGDPKAFGDEGYTGRIRTLLADKGYSNIEIEFIRVETRKDYVETEWESPWPVRRTELIIRLQQGYKSIVGNVTVRGNESTRDDVIRRYVSLFPGDTYDSNQKRLSDLRLRRTQWFEQAAPGQGVVSRTTPRLVVTEDGVIEYTDIDYDLVEGRTNRFNFSAGFNSSTGFTATVDLTLLNFDISALFNWIWGDWTGFTGAGQSLTFTAQPPLDRQQVYRVSFDEPWLFGYPVSGGVSAGYETLDRGDYTRGRIGIDPYVGWRVFQDVSWRFGYSYEIITISDIASNAPQEIKDDRGQSILSTLWTEIHWTTTDNPSFPTTGWDLSYRYEYTGGLLLGGTLDMWHMRANASLYVPLAELDSIRTLVLAFNATAAWQDVHTDTTAIPFSQRLFLGGNNVNGRGTLRGFRYAGVGPSRDDIAIGGNFMVTAFAELRVPIFPGNLWAVAFIDAGELSPTLNTFDGKGFTVSGGFGLRLLLPILPVPFALDFGFPIINQPGNREEVISINLGFGF